jgi:hypothetical protein
VLPRIKAKSPVHKPLGIGTTAAILQKVAGVPAEEYVKVCHGGSETYVNTRTIGKDRDSTYQNLKETPMPKRQE